MVLTDFAHPDSPEFAPVHTELARLYLAHKADLGLDSETDDDVANVSAITATLIG